MEVFFAEIRMGGKRGDLTKATREVAKTRRISYETLKRAVSRNRHLRELAATIDRPYAVMRALDHQQQQFNMIGNELKRRALGMPEDVLSALADADGIKLLKFLRANRIDMSCPQWFVDAVRQRRDLMSPK